ncbi:MAG: hypothetical protein AAF587_38365 [Bacteroidota bacterium]
MSFQSIQDAEKEIEKANVEASLQIIKEFCASVTPQDELWEQIFQKILLLRAENRKLEEQNQKGVISHENYQLSHNQLLERVISIIKKVESSFADSRYVFSETALSGQSLSASFSQQSSEENYFISPNEPSTLYQIPYLPIRYRQEIEQHYITITRLINQNDFKKALKEMGSFADKTFDKESQDLVTELVSRFHRMERIKKNPLKDVEDQINGFKSSCLTILNKVLENRYIINERYFQAKQFPMVQEGIFIEDGFIGLQKKLISLELFKEEGKNSFSSVRRGLLSHIASYMRLNKMSLDTGKQIYKNWRPEFKVNQYVELVNKRFAAFQGFIESGGIVMEAYSKQAIIDYSENRNTYYDKVSDPWLEIEERLTAILHYMEYDNYYISLLDVSPGIHFISKEGFGIIFDIRTVEYDKNHVLSTSGIYSSSELLVQEFNRKFESVRDLHANKEDARIFLKKTLEQVRKKKESHDIIS